MQGDSFNDWTLPKDICDVCGIDLAEHWRGRPCTFPDQTDSETGLFDSGPKPKINKRGGKKYPKGDKE